MVDVSQQEIPFVCINPVCNSVLQQLLQDVAILNSPDYQPAFSVEVC